MTRETIADFYHQIALLVQSHCPLPECLERASLAVSGGRFRTALADILERVRNGDKLSTALGEYPRYFDPLHVRLIAAAEKTDSLPDVLDAIAREARFEQLYVGKAREATMYPLFILNQASVLVLLVSTFFLPVYWETFADAEAHGHSIGWAARACMMVSQTIQHNALWLGICQGLVLIPTLWLFLGGIRAHRAIMRILEYLPGTSRIINAIDSARICGLWKLFLDRKLPVAEALRNVAGVVHGKRIRNAVLRVADGNERGEPLGTLLHAEESIDPLISSMVRFRPEANLPQGLRDLQNGFEQDVIVMTRNTAAFWTLASLVLMSAVVIGVALLIFIPVVTLPNTW